MEPDGTERSGDSLSHIPKFCSTLFQWLVLHNYYTIDGNSAAQFTDCAIDRICLSPIDFRSSLGYVTQPNHTTLANNI